jgi:hypothetical protein
MSNEEAILRAIFADEDASAGDGIDINRNMTDMRDLLKIINESGDPAVVPTGTPDANARAERAEEALRKIQALLDDWPTMRALSALGAERATAHKNEARKIIADVLSNDAPVTEEVSEFSWPPIPVERAQQAIEKARTNTGHLQSQPGDFLTHEEKDAVRSYFMRNGKGTDTFNSTLAKIARNRP